LPEKEHQSRRHDDRAARRQAASHQ
jgi:hypothetical protein